MRKPKIIISKCLNSEKCRYDGQGYDDKVILLLKEYIDIETICPEREIGLSIPREPIRIESHNNEYKLIQLKSNLDYTSQMNEFTEKFLSGIKDIDGFILKSKSPSCGIKDVKIYHKGQKCSISNDGNGFFSNKVIEKYSKLPIEDEGRLKNYSIRDEFLTRIFAINNLKDEKNILEFHNKNSLLLKSYNSDLSDELESVINKEKINQADIDLYKNKVYEVLGGKRNKKSKINIAKRVFEKYKTYLSENEIRHFQKLLMLYEEEKMPFSSLKIVLQMYAVRLDDIDLLIQTFFNPYPENLISITDSGKGRDL